MARKSYAERLQELEQQKARLAESEAKLKLESRKVRDRKLYAAGGLVEKAGLLDLDTNVLYGAFLSLRDGIDDKAKLADWATLGGRSFAREARLRDEDKKPTVLTFPEPLPKTATAALRAAGFRFSAVFQHWEGLARPEDAQALVAEYGGNASRVGSAGSATPPPIMNSFGKERGQPGEGTSPEDRRNDLLARVTPDSQTK